MLLVLPGIIMAGRSVAQKKDNNGQPDVKIDVRKEYDEKGNMILYDSIYSWSWSGSQDDMAFDTLMDNFRHHLEIYNYHEGDFFPHSFVLPQSPGINPEFSPGDKDTVPSQDFGEYLQEFFDDFLYGFHNFPGFPEWDFQPLSPDDTTGLWYDPFDNFFPDDYLEEMEKNLQEMREHFEKNTIPSPFIYNYFLYHDLKNRHNNRHKKDQNITKT
jgi:hypothetical protein